MIKKIIVCVFLLIATVSIAQKSTSSPYSLYGLGLETFRGDIANRSFGSLSTYSNVSAPNYLNPASYSDVKLTSLAVGGSYTTTNIEAEEGSGSGSATTFDYLAIAIPAGKFGFGLGIKPYRSVGYSFQETIEENENNDNDVNLFEGSGNVNRVYLATGVEVTKSFRIGAEFQYNFGRLEEEQVLNLQEWYFGSEFFIQNNNDYQDRFIDREGVSYTDAFGVKAGGFYVPKFNSLTNYLSKITYRAGFRYQELGLQINGIDINEFGISFGLGLPLPRQFSTLDLGFEVGSRGETTDTLVEENFFTVSLGLSLGQKWFKKRKFD